MESTLMPQRWEGMRGMDQFAKLQREGLQCKEDILVGVLRSVWGGHEVVDPEPAGQKVGFWWGL